MTVENGWRRNVELGLNIKTYHATPLNVTIGFDFGHDPGYEFSRSNLEFAISQPKIVKKWKVRI